MFKFTRLTIIINLSSTNKNHIESKNRTKSHIKYKNSEIFHFSDLIFHIQNDQNNCSSDWLISLSPHLFFPEIPFQPSEGFCDTHLSLSSVDRHRDNVQLNNLGMFYFDVKDAVFDEVGKHF